MKTKSKLKNAHRRLRLFVKDSPEQGTHTPLMADGRVNCSSLQAPLTLIHNRDVAHTVDPRDGLETNSCPLPRERGTGMLAAVMLGWQTEARRG